MIVKINFVDWSKESTHKTKVFLIFVINGSPTTQLLIRLEHGKDIKFHQWSRSDAGSQWNNKLQEVRNKITAVRRIVHTCSLVSVLVVLMACGMLCILLVAVLGYMIQIQLYGTMQKICVRLWPTFWTHHWTLPCLGTCNILCFFTTPLAFYQFF